MSRQRLQELTSGHLPLPAFRHVDPTAVGVVDLDRSVRPRPPGAGARIDDHRDGLLLIRLHGEPLAVVHVDRRLDLVSDEELYAEIRRAARGEIDRHVKRFGCAWTLAGSDASSRAGSSPTTCPGDKPAVGASSVAVIVCTAGREEPLTRCIRSLLAQRGARLELVIVDNRPDLGDTRRAVMSAAAGDPRVRYVAEPRVGLSVARNRGVSETGAELVAFTDDDVVADPSWLQWLVSSFAEPDVVAACGMVLPLELQTEAQKRFEQYAGFSKGLERRAYDLDMGPAAGRLLYPYVNGVIGVGNSMAFRRVELVAVGGFDPALGTGSPAGSCEETWAFSRMILRGGRIVYEPRAVCWHEHRKDGGALRDQVFGYGVGLGAVLTKALTHDPRFYLAAARSLPIAIGLRWRAMARRVDDSSDNGAVRPQELLRARREGIVRGPLRYAAGVVRARRLGLND